MPYYYYIQGFESTAGENEIKTAYRKRSQKFHLVLISAMLLVIFLKPEVNATKIAVEASSDNFVSSVPDVERLVHEWNDAHNTKDISVFVRLFDNAVFLYGTRLDKDGCVKSKIALLKKYKYFNQQITSKVLTATQPNGDIKCSFTKMAKVNFVFPAR